MIIIFFIIYTRASSNKCTYELTSSSLVDNAHYIYLGEKMNVHFCFSVDRELLMIYLSIFFFISKGLKVYNLCQPVFADKSGWFVALLLAHPSLYQAIPLLPTSFFFGGVGLDHNLQHIYKTKQVNNKAEKTTTNKYNKNIRYKNMNY